MHNRRGGGNILIERAISTGAKMNRCENDVMRAVYCLCDGTDSCLVSPYDILNVLPRRREYTAEKVEGALLSLKAGDFIDLIFSNRKGEKMYVLSLKANGQAFKSRYAQKRKEFCNKILTAFVGALATFIFGLILKAIFKA